mmetsp:Transcript_20629/g.41274  ORF Transcript_20629/g.41274 Transcript_20629/m.41274 type:complete len:364 (-) Transcript_20629:387-1478(-)
MASLNLRLSSSSFASSSAAFLLMAMRSSSILFCSSSIRLCSASISSAYFAVASSTELWPRAFVSVLRAFIATSRISSNWTFSQTFFRSGTRRGPNGATAVGESTSFDMLSMTMDAMRLCWVSFSLSALLSTGQRILSVLASTLTMKVVCMSFSTALMVSEGLHIAATTAGIAGLTSGLRLVEHTARIVDCALLETCVLVSQTRGVSLGRIFGSMTLTSRGEALASWVSMVSEVAFVLHSGFENASNRNGTTRHTAWVLSCCTRARRLSSAASRMDPWLWDECTSILGTRGTTKGSAGAPSTSHRALAMRREPSRAFGGGFVWLSVSFTAFITPCLRRERMPMALTAPARSAAAVDLDLVSLAV